MVSVWFSQSVQSWFMKSSANMIFKISLLWRGKKRIPVAHVLLTALPKKQEEKPLNCIYSSMGKAHAALITAEHLANVQTHALSTSKSEAAGNAK